MKPIVTYPDAERIIVDFLAEVLDGVLADDETPTVSVGVPPGWTPADTPHVEVAFDGTPEARHPMVMFPTVRVVVRAGSTSRAKKLAGVALAHLLGGPWPEGLQVSFLTGPLAARDPSTRAELASFTVRAAVRSIAVPALGTV